MTLNRKKILTEYVREHEIPLTELFTENEYSHPATDANGFCKFYNKETGECWVHPIKPETCRAGPITFDINLKARKVEFYLKTVEVCAFAALLFNNQASLKRHLKAAKEEILRLISELDVDALRDILKIPEPQTIKIDEDDLPEAVILKLGLL